MLGYKKKNSYKANMKKGKSLDQKSGEIKGWGHEIAAMMLMMINLINAQSHY